MAPLQRTPCWILFAFTLWAGCDGDEPTPPASDAGARDAMTGAPDAASTPDAANTGDAADTPDAAAVPDAAAPVDAAGTSDAADMRDALPAPDAALAPVTMVAFAERFAAPYCEAIGACCSPIADCEASARSRVSELLDAIGANETYDGDAAAACIAALEASPDACAAARQEADAYLAPCANVINGTVEPGSSCTSPIECARELGMIGDEEGGYVGCLEYGGMSGRCRSFRPTSEQGADCAGDPVAGDDATVHVCQPSSGLTCSAGTCQPAPRLGDPCPAAVCFEAVCDLDVPECVSPSLEDEACDRIRCAAGLECVADVCRPSASRLPSACLGFGCVEAAPLCG